MEVCECAKTCAAHRLDMCDIENRFDAIVILTFSGFGFSYLKGSRRLACDPLYDVNVLLFINEVPTISDFIYTEPTTITAFQ